MLNEIRDFFRRYSEGCKEHRRLLEREQLMLDRSKIVLLLDFSMLVTPEKETALSRIFDKYAKAHADNFESMINNPDVPFLALPKNLVDEKTRKDYMDWYRYKLIDINDFVPERDLPEPDHYYVTYLGSLIDCWDRAAAGNNFFDKTALNLIRRGKGQEIIGFWKEVNSLKDYSNHFPDRPPPPGNKRRQQETRPVFEPEWQPVPVPATGKRHR